jgi:general secretion pathway protein C
MIPKIIFTAINLICLTLTAYVAVDGFYGSVTSRLTRQPAAIQPAVAGSGQAATNRPPLSAYKTVLDRDLFDTRSAAAKPGSKTVDVESLEETKLNLKLWGTVSGVKGGNYAVIEDVKAREQNLYRTGDAIQTATVKQIYRQKVVLTVNGKDEILQMQELQSGKAGLRPGGPAARAGTSSSASGKVRSQRISLRRSYIEKSMEDMASLMTQVQIRPHMEGGVAAGLSLSSIKPNSIFRRMGLRNGDIITGVDGTEITTVDDALRLYENLKSASNLSVQLKRRGREKNIEYTIR